MNKEGAMNKIREQIRKDIHYDCQCDKCEELRSLLDYLVNIELANVNLEKIRQIVRSTENRTIEFAYSFSKIREILYETN
jgi:hypothetical protein